MAMTRREMLLGSGVAAFAIGAGHQAFAQISDPLKIGWMVTLTGPASAPGIGFDRGVRYAVDQLNAAGGVKGRKIELITRDTQGDPTKAVNTAQELISQQKVNILLGPTNSGEALATTPIFTRFKMVSLTGGAVDELIDPVKYPYAFRTAPYGKQWDEAVRTYCKTVLKPKKVAVIGDTTGYGVASVAQTVAGFKADGTDVAYSATIDATQADVTPDLLRMKDAGAEVIVVWTTSNGLQARILNARASQNWNVPVAGHPTLGSGEVRRLLDRPENWDDVYVVGFKSCTRDATGALPARTQQFIDQAHGKIELSDTLLFLVLISVDQVNLFAKAVADTGSTSGPTIADYFNHLKGFQGVFGDYSFSPQDHNGYATDQVVLCLANSGREGVMKRAPGYT